MTKKKAIRMLIEAGFTLVRIGNDHEYYRSGDVTVKVGNENKIPGWREREIRRAIKKVGAR